MEKNKTYWKDAVEHSKIPRIPWKEILGKSLTCYIRDNNRLSNDELMKVILLKTRDKLSYLNSLGWNMIKITDNLRIGLSARRSEQQIYW